MHIKHEDIIAVLPIMSFSAAEIPTSNCIILQVQKETNWHFLQFHMWLLFDFSSISQIFQVDCTIVLLQQPTYISIQIKK